MAYARTRTCCCCLPVRFGVFAMAFLGLLGGSLVSAVTILQIRHIQVGKPTLVVQVIMYILLALISTFGLMGAILRRRRLIAVFWAMLTAHLIFSIVSGSFSLNSLFKDAPANLDKCIAASEDPTTAESICKKGETAIKAVMITILIIIWLVQIYACIIVDRYTKQLSEEEDAMFKEETGRPTW